jgi:pimeloyl-ACP methyl ester carboxylesterase
MQQESLYIPVSSQELHLRHIWQEEAGMPVLMLHGTIENGKIFYSRSGKGLACYLARHGFDVYVADFRGRGKSKPSIKESPDHGQTECIVEDIPTFINYVFEKTGKPVHIICHSWGGVMLASSLVRFPELKNKVASKICFGTKRQIRVWNLERLVKISLVWKRLCPLLAKKLGYLDAPKLKIGSDLETLRSLQDSLCWITPGDWIDPVDSFNYAEAAKGFNWPPTWHITGIKDHALGHSKDVQLFIEECNNHTAKFSLLSKASGNKVDYDHINILTHPMAEQDHFPQVVEWIRSNDYSSSSSPN